MLLHITTSYDDVFCRNINKVVQSHGILQHHFYYLNLESFNNPILLLCKKNGLYVPGPWTTVGSNLSIAAVSQLKGPVSAAVYSEFCLNRGRLGPG